MQNLLVLDTLLDLPLALVVLDGLYQVSIFVQHLLYLGRVGRRPLAAPLRVGER